MAFPSKLIACLIRRQLHGLMPSLVARPSIPQIKAALTGPGDHFELEEVMIDGRPVKTWKNAKQDLTDFVNASRDYGDTDFIVLNDERLSYAEHFRQVARMSHALIDKFGIQKGDRVAIAMRNYPEWSVAFWSIVSAGAILVPMNAWWTPREMAYGLTDSGARLVFCDDKRLERILEIEEDLPVEHLVVARAENIPDSTHQMGPLISEGDGDKLPDVDIHPDDEATMFYTSGTTGFPKGTIGTHRNFCSSGMNSMYSVFQTMLRGRTPLMEIAKMAKVQQCMLLPVPMFHVTGCQGVLLGSFSNGGKIVMMNFWDPATALDLIEKERVTAFIGVPVMSSQLCDQPGVEQRDMSSVKNIGSGGAAVPPELAERIRKTFPNTTFSNGYGITETSATLSSISGPDYEERPTSAGIPSASVDIRIVGSQGQDMPAGEPGEIWVRTPTLVKGYWNKPEATAEAFVDGWYRTGDVGRLDADGFLYIEDRIKDMVIRGGENIYSAEVEAALSEHPQVRISCVFGIPDDAMGEAVGAVVEVDPGTELEESALQEFVAKGLAGFKVPSKIWIQDSPFPLGATGKVLKKDRRAH